MMQVNVMNLMSTPSTAESRKLQSHWQFPNMSKIAIASMKLIMATTVAFCTVTLSSSFVPVFAQGSNGIASPVSGSTGAPVTDSNPVTASDARQNYFKRYPFAQDAYKNDVLIKVDDGNNTPDGIHPVSRMQRSAPGVPNFVLAYIPMYNSMPYYQWPCPALDTPATMRDNELFDHQLTTFGVPVSDSQFQIIDRENKQRFLELMFDPERMMWTVSNLGIGANTANSLAGTSESAFNTAVNRIASPGGTAAGGTGGTGGTGGAGGINAGGLSGIGSLLSGSTLGPSGGGLGIMPNIANEGTGVYTASDNPNKSIPQAIWMVQQMYKYVFVPMAILFLLPGAVATQVKGQVAFAFKLNQDDNSSPFEGILRSMIAIFLIPATQLIVSYSIDVGNSMCYSVSDYVDPQVCMDWANKLTYNTPVGNVDNSISPPAPVNTAASAGSNGGFLSSVLGSGGASSVSGALSAASGLPGIGALFSALGSALGANFGTNGEGLGAQQQETSTINERQLWLSTVLELIFNVASYLFSLAVIVLGAFQLVMLCYLYLLGPLAAAMFAWPKIGQNISRDMFGGWCNAVIMVSLWRFYWMVILAIMTQRILYMMDTNSPIDLQWEVCVFVCFLGLMMYVPFNPWSFDPGQAFEAAMSSGQSLAQSAGGAMGQAAAAAGVPQSQINQVGAAFNQAMAPGQEMTNNMYGAQMSVVNQFQPTRGGSSDGAMGSGMGQGQASQPAPGPQASAPQAVPAMGSTSVATSMPPQSSHGTDVAANDGNGSHSAPPTAPTADNPTVAAAAEAAPQGTQVAQQSEPHVPLTPSGSGVQMAVNGNVTPGEAQQGVQDVQPQMAAAGVASPGAAAGAPPTESSTSSSAGTASSSPPPTQLASNDVSPSPTTNPDPSASNPSTGSEGPPVA
jgi:hypothetical protein